MKYETNGFNIKVQEKSTVKTEAVTQIPMYTNIAQNSENKDGQMQYPLTVKTRSWVFSDWLNDAHSEGIGGAYKYYAYTWIAIVGAVAFSFINPWIAGAFAFLAGYSRGERMIHQAWYKLWFSTKSYLITK